MHTAAHTSILMYTLQNYIVYIVCKNIRRNIVMHQLLLYISLRFAKSNGTQEIQDTYAHAAQKFYNEQLNTIPV